MNLNSVVGNVISTVNPRRPATLAISTGSTTNPNSSRTPSYLPLRSVLAQVQPMTGGDLRQVDGLNLNGTRKSVYLYGDVDAIVRASNKGGDLVNLADDNTVYLVHQVLEHWPKRWVKVAATLQNGS